NSPKNPHQGGVSLFFVAMVAKNELNDNFLEYFDESVEFRQHTDKVTDNLTGMYLIEFAMDSGQSGGVSSPEFLTKLESFGEWLEQQSEVLHVSILTDVFKRLNKNLHSDDESYYRIPEDRELAAQYLLLYEMSLPYGLDLNNQINVDKSATRVTAKLKTMTSKEVLDFEQRILGWFDDNAPELSTYGVSPTVIFSHLGMRNIKSMIIGTTIALVLISVLLIFALRSFKIGALSVVPNLLPVGIGFGIWGLLVGEIGLALSVVAGMTLGVVVDDTVHFLSKYLRARRERGLNSEDAIRYAFSTVGVALTVNTVVLVAGFLVLATSAFRVNSDMGLLTAITIFIALVADFLLLPALLMKIDRGQNESS
ncbi:MAG: MMPL family transporter, partial [Pseudomonadota bacterium]